MFSINLFPHNIRRWAALFVVSLSASRQKLKQTLKLRKHGFIYQLIRSTILPLEAKPSIKPKASLRRLMIKHLLYPGENIRQIKTGLQQVTWGCEPGSLAYSINCGPHHHRTSHPCQVRYMTVIFCAQCSERRRGSCTLLDVRYVL